MLAMLVFLLRDADLPTSYFTQIREGVTKVTMVKATNATQLTIEGKE